MNLVFRESERKMLVLLTFFDRKSSPMPGVRDGVACASAINWCSLGMKLMFPLAGSQLTVTF